MSRKILPFLLCAAIAGCSPEEEVDPMPDGGQPSLTDAGNDAGPDPAETDCPNPPQYTENVSACLPLATDYQPRTNGSADDRWAACISDDGAYHKINDSISTIARSEAFEQIAALLFTGEAPSPQDFLDARIIYAQDQGIDSRVQRREDMHYPAAAGGAKCSDQGIPEQYPDRCAGPAKLLPILNDAFAKGAKGEAPRIQAARIEAALLWFFYLSPLSEATSCGAKPQDCDSCWAYFTGGAPFESPIALGRYLKELAPETYARAHDGVLAVRCWRNLDNETGTAENTTLQLQARDQLDQALTRGMGLILRQRIAELACADEAGTEARLAFIRTLAPLLDHPLRAVDAERADDLAAQLADGNQPDVTAAVELIDEALPCP